MVASGLVVGFATGGFPAYSKEISQVALVLGMTFSMTEISISGISPRAELRPFLVAFGMSYVVLSGLILAFAVLSPDPQIRSGWVLNAAAPPADRYWPIPSSSRLSPCFRSDGPSYWVGLFSCSRGRSASHGRIGWP